MIPRNPPFLPPFFIAAKREQGMRPIVVGVGIAAIQQGGVLELCDAVSVSPACGKAYAVIKERHGVIRSNRRSLSEIGDRVVETVLLEKRHSQIP